MQRRRTDRGSTHRDAFRPFQDDLAALLIGQSAAGRHVKYTFLFLAIFVQDRLLPAQAEKAIRACTQCIKSPRRGDFTSSGKGNAHRAQCIPSCVFCTPHNGLCRVSSAFCILFSDAWTVAKAFCIPRRAFRLLLHASRLLADAEWPALFGPCIAHPAFCRPCRASLIPRAANCLMAPATRSLHRASRLRLDAPASTG